ncbi:MAG: NAD-dependent epimerase/dehydratase family protein [Rhodanobacteraceae bacterium]|nr:NAD-dependent epimerase/dehydratase family protein [Rhodanobacteraceae bacterium]
MDRRRWLQLAAATTAAWTAGRILPAAQAATPSLRILILGGTGFIGPHQVHYALSRGHKLTLFNRGRKPRQWPGEVEELQGDRNTGDLAALEGREWDVCIDNPTTLPFWIRDAGQRLKGKVGHYIFLSTVSVYATNDTPGAVENAPLARYEGTDAMQETQETLRANMALYGPLKARCEQEVTHWFGDRCTLIRPGLIVGPGDETDRYTYWPVRIARGGVVLAPGSGTDPVQFIDARDLAEWTIRMAEQRASGAFNAIGPAKTLTMREMLHGIRAALKSTAEFTWVDTEFLEAQQVAAWSDMPVFVPGEGDSAGFARRSITRARQHGLSFRPLATTAADTLAWWREQPAERQARLRAGISAERERELISLWDNRKK